MKVKVNIINTGCIPMFEAVTVSSLMMMTLIVSEELLARDRETNRQTERQRDTPPHTHTLSRPSTLKFANKNQGRQNQKNLKKFTPKTVKEGFRDGSFSPQLNETEQKLFSSQVK